MGIKDFSKTFEAVRTVKFKDLKGKTIAIDAMTELYRAALGAKSVSLLTDRYGKSTLHISVILSNILEMQKQKITQIWIFDYDPAHSSSEAFHNPAKLEELEKRKKRKDVANQKLIELQKEQALFSDSDEDEPSKSVNQNTSKLVDQSASGSIDQKKQHDDQKNKLEKQTFSVSKEMINDVKLILNCLNIKYIEAPKGFEGEQIAAYLSATDQVDGVFSGDTDPIPFGAKYLYRKNPRDKKIYEYTQEDIIRQIKENNDNEHSPTINDIRKICLILGSDLGGEKTPGVGAKTVLKKFDKIKLTKRQLQGLKAFQKEPEDDIETQNFDKEAFKDTQHQVLIDWLVNERTFKRSRIQSWFDKVIKS